ncbi:hypothetical protein ERJ70_15385 [Sediminibacillus dalangtanensis]|uniref:DUF4178 domain-containing protein n=1 Tax=Sediminibacillus dalangtanensis TaxID=2729421 RepID=A0ABX7W0E6_9BACI|nr:hypothetical protein [Sediminibacillus dalangtanensis]QTN00557.1 hypothetical protein ERJ70_15385 [Sediminibacillus dalangtanensis]
MRNPLSKKIYRRMLLRDLFFGRLHSWILLLLYALLWKVLFTITKIGQLKTNVPLFMVIGAGLLFLLIYQVNLYRKQMKKAYLYNPDNYLEVHGSILEIYSSAEGRRHTLLLDDLIRLKENKQWYFLYFGDKTFFPILKSSNLSIDRLEKSKPLPFTVWMVVPALLLLITAFGVYNVGKNAVNFNGAQAWKLNELKTDTKIRLDNDDFFTAKLEGVMEDVKEKMDMEPNLMTNDLEIEFDRDGTITSIYMYLYGYDDEHLLQSGYLIYSEKPAGNKVTVHKQDWEGEGTETYNPANDFSIVINMLDNIDLEADIKNWEANHFGVLYKGIRNWGGNHEGIVYLDENGEHSFPAVSDWGIAGPSVSLYVPGKEEQITPIRYVYKPSSTIN